MHDRHPRVVQARGEQGGVTGRGEDMAYACVGQRVNDRRILLPSLDHQIGRDGLVGELAHASQVCAAFGCEGLDHPETARLRNGRREFGARDVRHRRLNDRVLDAQ